MFFLCGCQDGPDDEHRRHVDGVYTVTHRSRQTVDQKSYSYGDAEDDSDAKPQRNTPVYAHVGIVALLLTMAMAAVVGLKADDYGVFYVRVLDGDALIVCGRIVELIDCVAAQYCAGFAADKGPYATNRGARDGESASDGGRAFTSRFLVPLA